MKIFVFEVILIDCAIIRNFNDFIFFFVESDFNEFICFRFDEWKKLVTFISIFMMFRMKKYCEKILSTCIQKCEKMKNLQKCDDIFELFFDNFSSRSKNLINFDCTSTIKCEIEKLFNRIYFSNNSTINLWSIHFFDRWFVILCFLTIVFSKKIINFEISIHCWFELCDFCRSWKLSFLFFF